MAEAFKSLVQTGKSTFISAFFTVHGKIESGGRLPHSPLSNVLTHQLHHNFSVPNDGPKQPLNLEPFTGLQRVCQLVTSARSGLNSFQSIFTLALFSCYPVHHPLRMYGT